MNGLRSTRELLLTLEAHRYHAPNATLDGFRYEDLGRAREFFESLGDIDGIAGMMRTRRGSGDGAEAGPGEGSRSPAVMPGVRIERVAEEETVAGFAAQHYRVFLEDLLVEELWIAPDITAVTVGAGGSLAAFLDIMTGNGEVGDFPPGYEEQEAYRELSGRGYVVRQITYFRQEENRVEVVKAERTTLPPGIFEVPEEMEERPYRKLFLGKD